MTRYEARALYKAYDRDVFKGDMGYLGWDERPEVIVRTRFYLEEVVIWQEYNDPFEKFSVQPNKSVLEIIVQSDGGKNIFHIIEDLDVFDTLMGFIEEKCNDNQ